MQGIMVLVGIISGLVFAAAGVLLFINSLLTAPFTALLTALITGIVFLFVVLIGAFVSERGSALRECLRCNTGALFFGIFGTIAAGSIAVSVDLAAGSVIAAVMIGLTAFFFAFMLVSALFTVRCITDRAVGSQ